MVQDRMDDLDSWFPRDNFGQPLGSGAGAERLGVVVGGSLSRGLAIKLDAGVSVESLAVGRYVVIRGDEGRFFCMINDIRLEATNAGVESDPPHSLDPFLGAVLTGTVTYVVALVTPMLVIDDQSGPTPVKTIPAHFAQVFNATVGDVDAVFGQEDAVHFNVGSPLELEETAINLDLRRLAERSVGVFGKSGTGKSFLTRVLLAGMLSKGVAVSLIFDMHNDYGWEIIDERGGKVKGLKQLFPSRVAILTLDPESSRKRAAKIDAEVRLGYNEIQPEDVAMLKETMGLSDTMIDAAYTLQKIRGERWIQALLTESLDDLAAETTNLFPGTLAALQRRLARLERWGFLVPANHDDASVNQIIDLLVNQRISVVLEFGRYGNSLDAYMLVANYLTRRIHQRYVDLMEQALGQSSEEPPQLIITIEEAHKFLEPQVARQTTFGIIARELRKYNVTLLVVDQRPSAIDEEVMSQIGTRVTALLDNERDVNAVLNGVSGAQSLREVLARLETRQQAIIMGHAVPMPVVIRPRSYDEQFYATMAGSGDDQDRQRRAMGSGGRRRL
jgi:uncharacterized protein